MVQLVLIGVGAGAAAGLLFASVAAHSVLSVFLFYLAPLPILIAALGWSHWAGLVATLTAAAGLAAVFSSFFFLAFLFGIGLPAWWLGYLALLARPAPTSPDALEWYPVGRLVFWAAVLGALVVVAAIPYFGTEAESFRATLKTGLERAFRLQTGTPANEPLRLPGVPDANSVIEFFAIAIPPAAAVLMTITFAFNLWLAGRIVKVSGRLRRPWPDISAVTLPPYTSATLVTAVAGSFVPGLAGIIAGLFAASQLMAYAVLGLAVLHAITRSVQSRAFVLAGVYAAIALFHWPLVAMALLGLADTAFDLRRRVAVKRGPPAAPRS
jgi:hypothetical protein